MSTESKSFLKIMSISEALECLQAGKVLIHPTETCYGLAVDATQSSALDKLFALKKRDASKPVSLLLGSPEHFEKLAEVSSVTQKLIEKFLPGPLTLVLPLIKKAQDKFDPRIHGGTGWVGLRLTSCSSTQSLAQKFDRPLTSTSANLSGEPEIYHLKELEQVFAQDDLAVLGEQDLTRTPPSTVIKVDGNQIEVLREGSIKIETIRDVL